jgi:DNA invertase Pin-like site-specific DNA recombinase
MSQVKNAPVPAVAYVRKSTRGNRKDGREKQEKSLPDQRADVVKLARAEGCNILRWYEDEGVSGWKREKARPGFARMLADAREKGDFRVILVDDADRFSRASWRKCVRDVDDLAEAGVETIYSVNDGEFRVGDETDAGEAHRLVAVAMANHESSRKLSRRITRTRRNAAREGKRTGGPAPYGLKDDGQGGLVHGNPKHIEVVRWLFDQVGNHRVSLSRLAGRLNKDGLHGNGKPLPAPGGGKWYIKTISGILRRRCYRGDFVFNRNPEGQFYGIDEKGEVAERVRIDGKGKVFVVSGKYTPLVDPDLFDRVQERLDLLAKNRSRRKRMGYALSGVLVCGHCGKPMYGMKEKPTDWFVVYRCQRDKNLGLGSCGYHRVREDVILPFVLRLLGEEIKDVLAMLSSPPDSLVQPHNEQVELRRQKEQERDELAAEVEQAEVRMLKTNDDRIFKSLEARVTKMRDELDRLDAELSERPRNAGFTAEDTSAWQAWWDDFHAKAISVPVTGKPHDVFAFYQDPDIHDEQSLLMDPRVVNEKLLELGAEVRLWWEKKEVKTKSGDKTMTRHVVRKGRFRLGQREGDIPGEVLEPSVCRASTPPSTANWRTRSWPPAPW